MKTKIIHPHKDETYRVTMDDDHLMVSSGLSKGTPKVWLSRSLIAWIKAYEAYLWELRDDDPKEYDRFWSEDDEVEE